MYTGLLEVTQGSSFSYNFFVTGSDGLPFNMSGYHGFAPIKLRYGSSGILDNFNFQIVNTGSGYCNISLLPIQTDVYPVTQGVYEIDIFDVLNSGAFQFQFARGYINVNPDLTAFVSGYNVLDGGSF